MDLQQQNKFIEGLLNPFGMVLPKIKVKDMAPLKSLIEYRITNLKFKISSQDSFFKQAKSLIKAVEEQSAKIEKAELEYEQLKSEFNEVLELKRLHNTQQLENMTEKLITLEMNIANSNLHSSIFEYLYFVKYTES